MTNNRKEVRNDVCINNITNIISNWYIIHPLEMYDRLKQSYF